MTDERKMELSRKLIIEALRKYRGLFNKSPSDDDLETYGDMLVSEYEFKQVTWALSQHVKKGSAFFPSCGEIFSYLTPKVESAADRAPQVAMEILNAIRTYGPHAEVEMMQMVSEDARHTLLAIGFTGDIRNSENYETTKAQIERLARGVLASKESTVKNEKLERIGIATGKVLPMNKPGMKTIDFSTFLNGPA